MNFARVMVVAVLHKRKYILNFHRISMLSSNTSFFFLSFYLTHEYVELNTKTVFFFLSVSCQTELRTKKKSTLISSMKS